MRLYNALLGEAEKRLGLSTSHPMWETAKAMPKTVVGKKKDSRIANPDRQDLFNAIHQETGWTDFDLQSFASQTANAAKWIADKVDANTQQKLATRAFEATERLLYGNAKSIRFKVPSRFRSMEGKTNKQGIRFKNNQFVWGKLIAGRTTARAGVINGSMMWSATRVPMTAAPQYRGNYGVIQYEVFGSVTDQPPLMNHPNISFIENRRGKLNSGCKRKVHAISGPDKTTGCL